MTLERATELILLQLQFKSGYNRNAVRMILSEVAHVHGQAAVDQLINELGLEQKFGLTPGTDFSSVRR